MSERLSTCPRCGARLATESRLGELCPRCLVGLAFEAGEPPADRPPIAFGRYRLIEKLGEGGMGVVWLAQQDHPIKRAVALKVLKPGAASGRVLSRFESERQALAMLNHPHIATVYDAGISDDGQPYFAMEYVPGQTITAYADQHALSIAVRLELFLQVCEAVEHAHQKGVIHRDLKPTNLLIADLDGRPNVKVIDFGVAKAIGPQLSEETAHTEIGSLVGTPEYMSPEQAGLSDAAVDTRTDIYSLGLILYELLVGGLPFDARELRRKAIMEMLRVIREEDPPPLTSRLTSQSHAEIDEIARRRLTEPRALVRELRGDLEWIARRALEKDPARRYPSASELGADIRRHLASEPVAAGPPGLRYRLGKLARRHRGAALAASVALTVLIAGAVISTALWITADRARRENRERLKALHVATGLQLAGEGEDLKALPWLVRALQLEEGGPRAEEIHRIRIRHVLDHSPYPVRIWHHEGLTDAYFAPDRTTLATWDDGGTVRLWDVTRGESIGRPLAHPARIAAVHLLASSLVTGDVQGTVRIWDTRAATETVKPIVHGPGLNHVRLSADGSKVLSADREGGIGIWALPSGQPLASVRHTSPIESVEFLDGGRTFAAGDLAGELLIGESDSGRILARLAHSRGVISIVEADPDRLITAAENGVSRVWDRRTSTLQSATPLVPNGVRFVRFSPDTTEAFMCGMDGGVRVGIGQPTEPRRLGTQADCTAVDVSDDGQLAATAYQDGTVQVWLTGGVPFTARLPHTAGILQVGFLRDSRQLIAIDTDGVMRVWELSPAAPPPRALAGYTYRATFSPDGKRLAVATGIPADPYVGHVSIIDSITRESLVPPLRHGGNPRGVAFSRGGTLIATASDDGSARVWDAATGEPISGELRHAAPGGLRDLVFSRDDGRLLTFGMMAFGSYPTLWQMPGGQRIASFPADTAFTGSFSPDGRHVVITTNHDRRVQVWQARDGRPVPGASWSPGFDAAFLSDSRVAITGLRTLEVRALDGAPTPPPVAIPMASNVVATDDRRTLVVATTTGAIHVLDVAGAIRPRFPPLRLPSAIAAMGVSADNRWVAGASVDKYAQVWSLETGEPVTPQRFVSNLPSAATFTADSSRVQISGLDATVWELRPDDRSMPTLENLSQLWSGHELAGTQLVTVPIDRLLDLARDRDLLQPHAAPEEANWRQMRARYEAFRRNWTAAESLLAPLASAPDATWEVRAAHGHALAELGRWRDAEAAFSGALARRPDWTELTYYAALAASAAGDGAAIDRACAGSLQTHGATRNPDRAHWLAALCVLGSLPDVPARARLRDLAKIAADLEPDVERHVSVYASALLRAGDAVGAETVLAELLARPQVRFRRGETLLILAAAQRQAGRSREAVDSVARFEVSQQSAPLPWHRRLEVDIWQRELPAPARR